MRHYAPDPAKYPFIHLELLRNAELVAFGIGHHHPLPSFERIRMTFLNDHQANNGGAISPIH